MAAPFLENNPARLLPAQSFRLPARNLPCGPGCWVQSACARADLHAIRAYEVLVPIDTTAMTKAAGAGRLNPRGRFRKADRNAGIDWILTY